MLSYKQLRANGRIDLAGAIPLTAPLTVYVEPTNLCNLSCDFCPQSLDDYKERAGYSQHMRVEMFAKVMGEIKEMKLKSLKLYFFGEPLLHPKLGEICKLASAACERVELTTNAIPLTSKKAMEIIDAEVDYVRVSLYGIKAQKVRDNVRGLRWLREVMRKKKPFICVKVHLASDLEATQAEYAGIADEVTCEGLHTIGSDFVHLSSAEGKQKACAYPFYTLVVKANGDVVPCCVAWETSLVVGNVGKQTLMEIWNGAALRRLHHLHLEGRRSELAACAKCDTLWHSPDSVDGVGVDKFEFRRMK